MAWSDAARAAAAETRRRHKGGLKTGDRVHGDYPGEKYKRLHVTYIHSSGKVKLANHLGVTQPNYRNQSNLIRIIAKRHSK